MNLHLSKARGVEPRLGILLQPVWGARSGIRSQKSPEFSSLQVDEASERRAPTFAQQGLRMAEAGV